MVVGELRLLRRVRWLLLLRLLRRVRWLLLLRLRRRVRWLLLLRLLRRVRLLLLQLLLPLSSSPPSRFVPPGIAPVSFPRFHGERQRNGGKMFGMQRRCGIHNGDTLKSRKGEDQCSCSSGSPFPLPPSPMAFGILNPHWMALRPSPPRKKRPK